MACSLSKADLRQEFKKRRKQLSVAERERQNKEISKCLFVLLNSLNASALLAYVSYGCEADTLQIINAAFATGLKVAAPRCNPKTSTMQFYEIASMDDLTCGFHNILEPAPHIVNPFKSNNNTVCIVPGVAFDVHGARIGYGGGYYDRFLANFKGKTVGLAYDCQVSTQPLPTEQHDQKLNYLITPHGALKC